MAFCLNTAWILRNYLLELYHCCHCRYLELAQLCVAYMLQTQQFASSPGRFVNESKSSGDSNFIQIQIPLDCYEGANMVNAEHNSYDVTSEDFQYAMVKDAVIRCFSPCPLTSLLLKLPGDAFVVEVDDAEFQMVPRSDRSTESADSLFLPSVTFQGCSPGLLTRRGDLYGHARGQDRPNDLVIHGK